MALSKKDEQLLELLLKEREQSVGSKQNKPFHIRALQFSMVFLSLVLFVTVGTLGVLVMSKPQSASAANNYTETWTATNGIYSSGGTTGGAYQVGLPSTGTGCSIYQYISNGIAESCSVTVTAWSVSGTIN